MRIPFPERIPWLYAGSFAFLLLVLQLLTGTDLLFSLLAFFFVITSVTAFNVAGGFTRPSGSYVFFFSVLTAIAGFVTKVVFLEPGDSRLRVPIPLMETYVAAMLGMLLAVFLARRFSRREGLLEGLINDGNMHGAVIGCVIAGVGLSLLAPLLGGDNQPETVFTPIFRAVRQVDRFLEMAIILGVTYEVRRSGGRRSLSIPVLIAWGVTFFEGVILGYSKEALFSPFICWILAAAVQGFRFKPVQLLSAACLFLFFYFYMVPYCQIGRVYRSTTNTFSQNLANSEKLLGNLNEVKRLDAQEREERTQDFDPAQSLNYTSLSHGLVDRLQMLSIDDTLHVVTDANGPSGLQVVVAYFANAVPRVIWKNKPDIATANQYGHELGFLAPEDETTSVSVSPVGEAYRVALWPGVLLLLPVLWFVLFLVVDSLCGDPRRSPWAILVIAIFAHGANEGGIALMTYILTFGVFGIIVVALITAYIFPLLAGFVIPTRKREYVTPRVSAVLPR